MKPSLSFLTLLTVQLTQAALATSPSGYHQRLNPPLVSTIFSLPTVHSWFENLAYRQSTNTIIATRLDVPQLWSIDPSTRTGTLLANVTGTVGLVGITQLTTTSPEVLIVAGANFSSTTGVQPNSSTLWSITFSGDRSYTVQEAFPIPELGLVNGITTWDSHTVLAADSTGGAIWKIDLDTGEAAVAIRDITLEPVTNVGVNGVKVLRHNSTSSYNRTQQTTYVYYTSTDQGLLARVPVDPVTAQRLPSSASVEVLAKGLGSPDDFALLEDGSVIIATGPNNTVVHVGLDGSVETVAGSQGSLELASSTACQLGPDGVLYVTTAGGEEAKVNGSLTEAGSVVAVDVGGRKW